MMKRILTSRGKLVKERERYPLRARLWVVGVSDNIGVQYIHVGDAVGSADEIIGRKLTRREMVEKLLTGVAAGAAWPLIASGHPIHQHLNNSANLDRASAAQTATSWKPLFLNPQQNEMLVAVSESIVPGSSKANVNRFIDLLLSVDTRDNREQFLASLRAIDGAANQQFGNGFRQLAGGEREVVLSNVSEDKAETQYFDHLKDWITVAFYSSEEGMRELGWTGNRAFKSFPGCDRKDESR